MPQHKGDKPHNPSWNQMEPRHDDGTECQKTMETIPGTLPGTRKWRWNRMPEDWGDNPRNPTRKQKDWGNDDGTKCQNTIDYPEPQNPGGTKLSLERVENPIQLQTCLGNKPRNTSRNQEGMMEQSARRVGRQAPEP